MDLAGNRIMKGSIKTHNEMLSNSFQSLLLSFISSIVFYGLLAIAVRMYSCKKASIAPVNSHWSGFQKFNDRKIWLHTSYVVSVVNAVIMVVLSLYASG
jgi:hypothetical protein